MPRRLLMLLWLFAPVESLAGSVSPGDTIPVLGKYTAPKSEEDDKPRGISGMGCLGLPSDPTRECLVINDEETFGEIVLLGKDGLRPTGKAVTLTHKTDPIDSILGSQQKANCDEAGKYGDLDGEGVAVEKTYVYVVGSHSCSGGGKYKPSNYLLVRFKPASAVAFVGTGKPVIERSWRVADILLLTPELHVAYGLPKGQGTNIEGLAVIDGTLYAGMRTPVDDGTAFIASARTDDLFAPGHKRLKAVGMTIRLSLGNNTGIRDLAALADGSLLILSGPTKSQTDIGYKIWYLPKPLSTSTPVELVTLTTSAKPKDEAEVAKAESITVTSQSEDRVTVIVNYDNIDEGAPASHQLRIGR
jgi:Protein of unknown function (DUF3616)